MVKYGKMLLNIPHLKPYKADKCKGTSSTLFGFSVFSGRSGSVDRRFPSAERRMSDRLWPQHTLFWGGRKCSIVNIKFLKQLQKTLQKKTSN